MRVFKFWLSLFVLLIPIASFADYYVGRGGKTSQPCGTSHYDRCENTSLLPDIKSPGEDIYILADSDNGNRSLLINWTGTQDDRVIIGCYYMDNGTETFCNEGSRQNEDQRPILRGSYDELAISQCNDKLEECPATTETAANDYVIKIEGSSNFVTIQDLYIRYSTGSGILIDAIPTSTVTNNIIQRNLIEDTVGSAIRVKNLSSNSLDFYRNNQIYRAARLNVDNISQFPIYGCFDLSYDDEKQETRFLFENNTIKNCGGYSIKVDKSDYNLIRENTITNSRQTNIYVTDSSFNVIEHNNILGGDFASATSNSQSDSINIYTKTNGNFARGNIVRNNIGLTIGDFEVGVIDLALSKVGATVIGNTFNTLAKTYNGTTQSNAYIFRADTLTDVELDSLVVKNNAFIGYTNTNCIMPSDLEDLDIDYNAFSNLPNDTDCQGTNTQTSNLLSSITGASSDNSPDIATSVYTAPTASTTGINSQGIPLLDSILDVDYYPQYVYSSGNICKPLASNWEKALFVDYFCNERSTTAPTLGAIEYRGEVVSAETETGSSNIGVVPLETANALFVDAEMGNDSYSCTSAVAPCKTLSGAFSKNHINGQDIFLKSESVFEDGETTRTINWNGSNQDPVIIGCYYISDSGEAVSCDSGEKAGELEYPIIKGDLTDACRNSNTCSLTSITTNGKKFNVLGDHVHIQNIQFYGILGRPIVADSLNYANGRVSIKVKDNIFKYVGTSAVQFDTDIRDSVIKGNEISNAGWCQIQNKVNSTSCKSSTGTAIPWSPAILLTKVPNANTLIEDNTIYNTFGEGVGITSGSSHIIIKGNRIGNMHTGAFLIDSSSDVVVESNVLWGIPTGTNPFYAISNRSYRQGNQIDATLKNNSLGTEFTKAPTNIVYRNNVSTGRGSCMSLAIAPSASTSSEGYQMSAYVYGNTCIDWNAQAVFGPLEENDFTDIEVKSNIFRTSVSTAVGCVNGYSSMVFDYNMWSTAPSDSNCTGTNDKISSGIYNSTVSSKNVYPNIPIIEDFRPRCDTSTNYNGDDEGDGSLETVTLLDSTDFTILSESTYPYVPNATNWEKSLYYDFSGEARDASAPAAGATEACYSTSTGSILYTPTEEGAYYVGTDGDDNNDCSSHETRCLTTDGLKNKVKSIGKDVYILAETDNGQRTFNVDWSGTDTNPVEIGCYYLYGTAEIPAKCNGAQVKPIIRGSVSDTCITNKSCSFDNVNAIPKSQYDGLINVTGSNVQISNLNIKQSAAIGIRVVANNNYENVTISGNDFEDTISSAVHLDKVKPAATYDVVSNSMDNVSIKRALFGTSKGATYPCVMVTGSSPTNDHTFAKVRSNNISNCSGSGVGYIKTKGGLIQSNRISNVSDFLISLDNSSGVVAEKNILVGKGYGDGSLEDIGSAFGVVVYDYGITGGSSTDNLIRNNLIANVKTGLYSVCLSDNCTSGANKIGYRLYGNTFAYLRSNILDSKSSVNSTTTDYIHIVNNVFHNVNSCIIQDLNDANKLNISNNAFIDVELSPSYYHCYGSNSVTGSNVEDVGFPSDLSSIYASSIPVVTDYSGLATLSILWKATIDGILVNSGVPTTDPIITEELLSEANYPFFATFSRRGLYYDYATTIRISNSFVNLGAWESISTP